MRKLHKYLDQVLEDKIPKSLMNKINAISKKHNADCCLELLNAETKPKSIFIIDSGIICAYTVDQKGKRYNNFLFQSGDLIIPITSFSNNIYSQYTYVCLSDCSFYEINYNALLELAKEDEIIENLYAKFIELNYAKIEKRVKDLLTLDATQGYLKVRDEFPNIDNMIHQYDIASYLNVTPVQLSRIRKKLF